MEDINLHDDDGSWDARNECCIKKMQDLKIKNALVISHFSL